jgi:hypothetical protein
MHRQNKKAAIELSIGTIVIIVLAMSMLILGLILVNKIFFGATDAAELINQNVKAQINKLFNDNQDRTVVFLPDNLATVKKGSSYNVRFAIRNVNTGSSVTGEAQEFTYEVTVGEPASDCPGGTTGSYATRAAKFIKLGQRDKVSLRPGDEPKERVIVVQPSDDAALCQVSYNIKVFPTGEPSNVYDTNFFILKVTG